ncbi:MAG: LysM peptidoglycan-binding domain-containing protein [Candidatus Marinimicrobia bacterium]|nr:LysM peptidoglycan-binding domain-containing protein [Candidatus Neomarinimicrobiota bacterium]
MKFINTSHMIWLAIVFGLILNTQGLAAGHAPMPSMVSMGQLIQPVLDLQDDDFLLEYFLQEAKRYYADARLMIVARDTLGVQFEVERLVATLAAIEEIDEPLPEEIRETVSGLSELASTDFNGLISEELQSLLGQPSLKDQLSRMSDLLDSLDSDVSFVVVDDRDGHLPLILNSRVKTMIKLLGERKHKEFQIWLDRYSQYASTIRPILASYGIPEELIYLAMIESGLNPKAYSYAHAVGPWQFISATGRRYGLKRDWWVDERRDFVKSTHAGAQYLKALYDEFDDWYLAMASYNTGESRVRRTIRREGHRDYWRMITLPRQTRNYVATVLAAAIICRDPESYGFTIKELTDWEYEIIEIDRSLDLDKIAYALRVDYQQLKAYNPELRQGVTPPSKTPYQLRVPLGKGDVLPKKMAAIPTSDKIDYQIHYVRRGETLSVIASRYNVSLTKLVQANRIKNRNRLSVGQKLVIPAPKRYTASTRRSKSSGSAPASSDYVKKVYRVKKGDTLGQIAENYRTTAKRIRYWNGLRYGEHIYPGQKLTLYTKKKNG